MAKGIVLAAGAALLAFGLSLSASRADPAAFESPQAAVDAVVAALEARDRQALLAVFGPEFEDLVFTGDPEEDREIWGSFLRDYRQMHRIAEDAGDGTAVLYVGRDQWPFPAPLVESAAGTWSFDPEAAREEVEDRRIGRNELDVIALLEAYVRVQQRYRLADQDGDGVMEFASAILSSAGKRDGLYWPSEAGAPESPIGDFVARASADGYSVGDDLAAPEPYLGYYYRILTEQGPAAPGGTMSYLVNGHMVAGHALLAFPAAYGDSGIMTFMVGENGIVYEADLGPDTLQRADAIETYDPAPPWAPVETETN